MSKMSQSWCWLQTRQHALILTPA